MFAMSIIVVLYNKIPARIPARYGLLESLQKKTHEVFSPNHLFLKGLQIGWFCLDFTNNGSYGTWLDQLEERDFLSQFEHQLMRQFIYHQQREKKQDSLAYTLCCLVPLKFYDSYSNNLTRIT